MEARATYVTLGAPKILPIDPTTDDPFYRYKMRQLSVQVIGNGKMIRTAFVNIDDVAKDLKVPPMYIPSYLAQRMGAQAKYDPKKPERERGSISGEYSVSELTEHLEAFIRDFVLCGRCQLPELSFLPGKKKVMVKCRSCGWKSDIEKMNLTAKFVKFVKNHPPPVTEDMKKEDRDQKEEERRRSEDQAHQAQAQAQADTDAMGDQILAEAAELQVPTTSAMDDWAFDTSAEAVAARAADMVPEKLRALVNDDDTAGAEPIAQFAAFLAANPKCNATIMQKELARLYKQHKVKTPAEQSAVVFGGLFGQDLPSMFKNAKAYKVPLKKMYGDQPARQTEFLSALDDAFDAAELDETQRAKVLKLLPAVLKFFYDNDIVDEEVFLQWSKLEVNGDEKQALRTAAKDFIAWLETAEEEDSDDDE